MPGGLLNISAIGEANVLLTGDPTNVIGNPKKTFFKVTYSKYTNFGLQKFRLDYTGQKELRLTEPSVFSFKVGRYADLLMDTYLSITLPDIWSPIHHPTPDTGNVWAPYEFRWIDNLGTQMIQEITITCGGYTLQRYSGQYLAAIVERDFTHDKKQSYYEMTGNIKELNDPGNAYGRVNAYPNAYVDGGGAAEPSIRGRNLYIPINTWFTLKSQCAFPLLCLQYNELYINVTIRPIRDLFIVRDVYDTENAFPLVQPDFNLPQFQMYRYLQSPAKPTINLLDYGNPDLKTWNADIHIVATYCFLSEEERIWFAKQDQVYLVKDVLEHTFNDVVETKTLSIPSNGLIASWMWFFQRNDVAMRNQWNNYTNWPYKSIPSDILVAPLTSSILEYGPGTNPPVNCFSIPRNTGFYITGTNNPDNVKEIMTSMSILLNGDYRENVLPAGVFQYIEKYIRSSGFSSSNGLYCYNFCLNTDPTEYQPSGAINTSKFKTLELKVTTITPSKDLANSNFNLYCDEDGNPIGTNKSTWRLYNYAFNMTLFEERYNVLSFVGGNCGMLYAK